MKISKKVILPLFTLLLVSVSGFCQTPKALKNVVGDNANYLEDYMKVEGYHYINRSKSGNNEYQNWWSNSDKQCVTVRITNNKVKSVIETLPADCGKSTNSYSSSQTPKALKNVVGDKVSYLEDYMKVEGYNYINRSKSGNNEYQNWWNHSNKQCVSVRILDNRVKSVVKNSPSDCGKSNNSYSNNNYNHNNNSYNNNTNYNHNRNNSYNNEYQHDNNYKYQNGEVKVNDLRNKSALSAYSDLQNRGFRDIKKHTDGGTTYHIWYNNSTNQCLKTVSKNKRISSIFNSTSDACPNR